ncbi:MAG: carbon-nitrogen hydrolase family protein, partial [Mesorhizobium sp.]
HNEPGVIVAEVDPAQSLAARRKIANLRNARDFTVNTGAGEALRLRGAAS